MNEAQATGIRVGFMMALAGGNFGAVVFGDPSYRWLNLPAGVLATLVAALIWGDLRKFERSSKQ